MPTPNAGSDASAKQKMIIVVKILERALQDVGSDSEIGQTILAALKPLAGGAPTSSALAAAFQAVEPKLFAAIAPKETGTVSDRLLAHVRSLVQIHDVGEVQGDDPARLDERLEG